MVVHLLFNRLPYFPTLPIILYNLIYKICALISQNIFLPFLLQISLPILFILHIGLHIGNQRINIRILNFILGHLHRILYHFIHQLHSFLLGGVGLHRVLELLNVDLVLCVAHDLGHSVHHVGHLVHRRH